MNRDGHTPFPGMDPYLEHPALWTDVHNSLIAAIRDALSPAVAPDYYIGLERRAYLLKPDDIVFVGRPDVAVVKERIPIAAVTAPILNGVLEVDVPMSDEVGEDYLEIREVKSGRLVTLIELLSPTNKVSKDGRQQYLEKRSQILITRTNLVEIDLLRGGEMMPVISEPTTSHYRILISRGHRRPRAQLYGFSLRQPIPEIAIPLLPHEQDVPLDLNEILHSLYHRARFDLRVDYRAPAVPPLDEEDAHWAKSLFDN